MGDFNNILWAQDFNSDRHFNCIMQRLWTECEQREWDIGVDFSSVKITQDQVESLLQKDVNDLKRKLQPQMESKPQQNYEPTVTQVPEYEEFKDDEFGCKDRTYGAVKGMIGSLLDITPDEKINEIEK